MTRLQNETLSPKKGRPTTCVFYLVILMLRPEPSPTVTEGHTGAGTQGGMDREFCLISLGCVLPGQTAASLAGSPTSAEAS